MFKQGYLLLFFETPQLSKAECINRRDAGIAVGATSIKNCSKRRARTTSNPIAAPWVRPYNHTASICTTQMVGENTSKSSGHGCISECS